MGQAKSLHDKQQLNERKKNQAKVPSLFKISTNAFTVFINQNFNKQRVPQPFFPGIIKEEQAVESYFHSVIPKDHDA